MSSIKNFKIFIIKLLSLEKVFDSIEIISCIKPIKNTEVIVVEVTKDIPLI